MATIRRFPGLRCENCGSDEFEYQLCCNVSDEVVGGDEFECELFLYCAHCPRAFSICGIRKFKDFSELYPFDYNNSESVVQLKADNMEGSEHND